MRYGRVTRQPTNRFAAALLFVLVLVTSVHGANSAAVPAGAIANPQASIGAALPHLVPHQVGRGEQETGTRRTAAHTWTSDERPDPPAAAPVTVARQATPIVVPAVTRPALTGTSVPAPDSHPGSTTRGRAPPA